jgi:thioredoxin-like negative regulator of GroEL
METPAPDQLKGMLARLAIPVVGAWVVGGTVAGFAQTTTLRIVMISIPVIVTLLALAVVIWVMRQAKKTRGVASILSGVESAEDRKAALAQLDATYKKNDPTAVFARAQLEMQDDPKKALSTLEQIDLSKVLGPVADETRAQRAMIHLTLGDVGPARQLVDNIDLSRQRDAKTRAMLTAISGEAWARTGNAKKAVETLALLDPEDAEYEKLRPQLYRAMAYGYAHTNDIKGMRRVLKKLVQLDVRLLGGFMSKRTHPLLQKEAKKVAEQSGLVPRKMVVQRRV